MSIIRGGNVRIDVGMHLVFSTIKSETLAQGRIVTLVIN